MTRAITSCGFSVMVLVLGLTGCNRSPDQPPSGASTQSAANANSAEAKQAAALAKLSSEDRKLAEQQKVCPVTDEPLGSMGVPEKVVVQGRTVFICCGGCAEDLNNDAAKYLAKLDKQATK